MRTLRQIDDLLTTEKPLDEGVEFLTPDQREGCQSCHTGATNHFAGEREIGRRQPDRAIANDFGGRAALPEQDHGAEDWVVGDAGEKLV